MSSRRHYAGKGKPYGVFPNLLADDDAWRALSSDAKVVLQVLEMNPAAGMSGIFRYVTAGVAAAANLSVEATEAALKELATHRSSRFRSSSTTPADVDSGSLGVASDGLGAESKALDWNSRSYCLFAAGR